MPPNCPELFLGVPVAETFAQFGSFEGCHLSASVALASVMSPLVSPACRTGHEFGSFKILGSRGPVRPLASEAF